MADEREELPALELKSIPLSVPGEKNTEKALKIKLDCAEAVKTGQSTYGDWHLWFGFVEKAKVVWGRGKDKRVEEEYTGKVLFFPTVKLNEKLVLATNGNVDVEVSITKTVEEGRRGLITKYEAEKLSIGRPQEASLTPSEINLLNDAEHLKSDGFPLTEDAFVKAAQDEKYGGQVTVERAKLLYTKIGN